MDPITIATTLLTAGAAVAKLAAAAIDASRSGDDTKALELLDEALATQRAQVAAAETALEDVRTRVAARIAAKFDNTEKPPTP